MPRGVPGSLTHGLGAYTHGRCKCDVCTAAMTEWKRNKYGYRTLAEYRAEVAAPHGSESRYTGPERCRCNACREAARAGRARRRSATRG